VKHVRYYWPLLAEGHLTRRDARAHLDVARADGLIAGACTSSAAVKKGRKTGAVSLKSREVVSARGVSGRARLLPGVQ
jgi:hypothetical protein